MYVFLYFIINTCIYIFVFIVGIFRNSAWYGENKTWTREEKVFIGAGTNYSTGKYIISYTCLLLC